MVILNSDDDSALHSDYTMFKNRKHEKFVRSPLEHLKVSFLKAETLSEINFKSHRSCECSVASEATNSLEFR